MQGALRATVRSGRGRWPRPLPGRRGGAPRALPCLLLVLGCAGGCASDWARTEQGFASRRRGYAVGEPGGPGGPWERFQLAGAELAFRRAGGETATLQVHCGRPTAAPQVMARHLRIGIPGRELRAAGPVVLAGREGWSQTFDAGDDGRRVRVKTVTVVDGDCTLDFALAAAARFEEAESAFDAWWQSSRLPPAAAGAGP